MIIDKFFKQKKISNYEQVIFIALLREEYSATDASLREMNTLIDLISFDEYERIKNRSLLEDGSNLLSNNIIDYEEMLNPFGGITRAFYIVDEVLQSIIHPNKNKKAKMFKRIDLKDLRNLLVHEDSMAGGYDLMDIVALKVIERSKIKTKIIKADIKNIEKALKGLRTGTEIILPK